MAGPRMKKARVRDKDKCGVHLGGCGELVSEKKDRSLDHIIPEAWFRSIGNENTSTDYNDIWNRQLMHKTCDNSKKGGHVHGLPAFWCHCHYLEVLGGDLFVVVRDSETADTPERHLLLKGYVNAPSDNPNGLSIFVNPISNNPKSWTKDGLLRMEVPDHHHLVMLRPEMVGGFNRQQNNRANKVFEAYKGSTPEFSIRDAGFVWDKDLSKLFPKKP